jgi:hypothetical protein
MRAEPEVTSRTVAEARVGENARVPAYAVNEDALKHAKRLIDARRYVLRSRWQDVQPRAREQARPRRRRRATRLSTATSAVCTGWG